MPLVKNTVSVEIYGHPIKALVDTGATMSCIALSVLSKLGVDRDKLRPLDATDAVGVGGENHCSLGAVSLPISFNGIIFSQEFQVFEKFHQPVILGLDFLRENEGIFNVAQNTLYLKDPTSPEIFAIDVNTGLARVKESVSIPPHSMATVEVLISNIAQETLILLEPLPKLPELGLVGAKCLVNPTQGQTFLQVINPSDQTVTLSGNQIVASASVIDSETVSLLDTPTLSKPDLDFSLTPDQIDFDLSKSGLPSHKKSC